MMSGYSDYQASQKAGSRQERRAVRKAGGKPKAPKKPHAHKLKAPAYNPLDDPNAVTAPQTLRQIYQHADTAANLRYGPQERALGLQKAQVPAWFQSYRDQVQGISTGIKTGYDQAVKDIGTRQAAVDSTDNTGRAALLAAAQKDAASRGATVDPSLFARDVGAQSVRGRGQSDFANLLTAQGNANSTYFGGLQTASSAGELAQKQRLGSEATALAGDKGLFRNQYATDATDTAFKNTLAAKAFNLDTYKAEATAGNAAARIKGTAKNAAAQRKATSRGERNSVITSGPFAGLTHGDVRKLSPQQKQQKTNAYNKGKGKPGGLTPAQKEARDTKSAKQTTRIQDAEGRWNLYKTQTVNGGKKPTPSMIKQRLIKEGFSTPEIHLALMWSSSKPWTAHDRQVAKRLGIRLPKRKPNKTEAGINNGTLAGPPAP